MMVDDVRLDHQRSDDRGLLGAVGVLEPMADAGQEVGQQDDAERLEEDMEGVHDVLLAVYFTSSGLWTVNRYS